MNKALFLPLAALIFSLVFVFPVQAQEQDIPAEEPALEAIAGKDRNARVSETVVFDGTGSFNPLDGTLLYEWEFGDGRKASGAEVTHTYNTPGEYAVVLRVNNGEKVAEDTLTVLVEQNIVVLVTDGTVPKEKIEALQEQGKRRGVLFVSVTVPRENSTYLLTEELTDRLLLVQDDLQKASLIVTWTTPGLGMQSLIGLEQRLAKSGASASELSDLGFASKVVVDISNSPYWLLQRVGESVLDLVGVQSVFLVRETVIQEILAHPTAEMFVRDYTVASEDFRHIKTTPSLSTWKYSNILFRLHNALLFRGTPLKSLLLILFVPVIACIIAFARALFGVRAFGIFVPTVVALALITTGIRHGLPLFVAVLVIASVIRYLFRRLRFLYLARIALVLTIVSLSLIMMLLLAASFDRFGFMAIPIFPVLVMVVLVEQFLAVQIDKGPGASVRTTIETLLLGVLGYYLANWGLFRVFVFGYPLFVILIVLVLIFILGRFVGLRIGEYIRFKNVIKHANISSKK